MHYLHQLPAVVAAVVDMAMKEDFQEEVVRSNIQEVEFSYT